MATAGRKPKPTEMKAVMGNPGRRPLPEGEPQFTKGELAPPAWLDEKGKTYRLEFLGEWERVVGQLEAWGIVGEVNQGAIVAICSVFAQASEAAKDGKTSEARMSFAEYRKALNEFGLTPASKGRVVVNEGEDTEGSGYFAA